jgi:hypothetical protein
MNVYLAGQMSYVPQFNIPRFDAVAELLRGRGFEVTNPAELDDEEVRNRAMASPDGAPNSAGPTWGEFLARDVQIVADKVTGIMLMDQWWNSRGARLEAFVALSCGHAFWTITPYNDVLKASRHTILHTVTKAMEHSI